MTLNDTQKALLTLLAQALWGNGGVLVETHWEQVEELAKDQGVLPMLYRGAMKYKDIIPAERIRIWRGAMYAAVLQNVVRSLFGLRKKKSVFRVLKQSNRRFELHKRLHLYEVK